MPIKPMVDVPPLPGEGLLRELYERLPQPVQSGLEMLMPDQNDIMQVGGPASVMVKDPLMRQMLTNTFKAYSPRVLQEFADMYPRIASTLKPAGIYVREGVEGSKKYVKPVEKKLNDIWQNLAGWGIDPKEGMYNQADIAGGHFMEKQLSDPDSIVFPTFGKTK